MANQESRLAIVIDSKDAEQNIKRLRTALKNIGKETVEAGSGLELLTEAMEPLKKYDSVFTKASGAAKDLAKSTKDMSKEVLAASKGISTLNDDTKKSADSSNKLQNAVDNTAKEVREFGAITDAAGVAVWGMGDKAEESAQDVDKLGDKAKDAKSGLKDLGDEAEKSKSKLERLKDSVNNFNESMSGLRNAALVGMGALTGVLYKSVDAAQGFETAMAEINKTVDFAAPDGLAKMRSELEELTTVIPLPFEALAAVTAAGGQLGIAEKDLVKFTEVMAKMGVAFDMPAEQAADSMAKIANVFSIPITEIDKLGDAINTLSNNTPAKASEIIDALQRVGGVAKVFGLTEDATAGLAGALIALGKPPEVAATAINSMLTTFSTLDNASKTQRIGFEKLGVDIDEFAQLVATKPKEAIETYLEAVNKLPQSERVGTNAMIIGKDFGDDITMLAGSVGVLTNNWEMLGETAGSTKDYMGSMQKEFEAMAGTSAAQMQILKSSMDNLFAAVGTALLPAFNDIVDAIKPVVLEMTNWAKENPELVKQILLISGAVGGFILAVSGIGLFVSGLLAIANPVGLAVLAIGALIGIGVALVANWDSIKAKAAEVWEGIKTYVSDAWESIKETMSGFGESVGEAFSGIGESISEKFNAVKEYLSGVWESIKQSVVDAFTSVGDTLSGAFDSVKEYLSGIWESVKQQAIDAFNAMPEPVHEAVANIKEAFNFFADVWSAVQLGAQLAFEIVKSTASSAADWIIAKWNSFKEIVSAVWQGVSTAASLALEIMKAAASSAVEWIKGKWSGFKDFMSGVWDGIVAVVTPAMDAIGSAVMAGVEVVKSVFSTAFNGLKVVVSTAMSAVKAVITLQWEGIKAVFVAGITILASIFNTGFNLVKNTISTVMNVIKALIRGDMQGVVDAFKTGLNNAVNIVKKGAGDIANAVKDLGTKLFKAGVDAVQGLINGIKSKIAGVKSAASELGQAAWGGVKSFLQIRSPSRKMAELGKHTADGLAKGIKKNKKPVISEAQKMAQEAVKAVKDTIATLQRDIALFGNDDPIAAMLWDKANTDKYKGVGDSLFNQAVDLTKQKEALELAEKFKEALKGIQDSINGSVSTELEKWAIALYGGNKELSKLKTNKKSELLGEAANLDFSNLSKEVAKGNLEIDRQIELMGARTDLDKELLKIGYDLTDTMAQYSYYLETGQEARYNELESLAMIRAEREKGLAILKEEQKLKDSLDSDLSGIRTELLGYGINETDSDKNDYQLADTLARLRQAHEMQLMQQDEFQNLSEIAKQRHADKMAEIENAMYQNRAGLFASASKALLGENSKMYRLLFATEKGYALQSAWLEHKKSILKAYSETPGSVWAKAAAAAKAAADTGLMAAAIAAVQAPIGQAHDGIMSVPKSGTWNLEKGERVLPAHTAKAMDKKLEQGGKVIIHNHSGEKAEAKQDMDGNTIITIGKMINNVVDAKISNWEQNANRPGGTLYNLAMA